MVVRQEHEGVGPNVLGDELGVVAEVLSGEVLGDAEMAE
jgi:hypothetical protein